jgi:hypothetical protein
MTANAADSQVRHSILDSPQQEWLRDSEAERLGGSEVDHELEFRGLFDRQIGGSKLTFVSPSNLGAVRTTGARAPTRTIKSKAA